MDTLLKVENLSVSYGAIEALKNINLTLKKGSVVAILGSNGAGKTTLLKRISGLIGSQQGAIYFNGENITKFSPEKITKNGIIQSPEGRQIFPDLTVYENLMIGAFTASAQKVLPKNIYNSVKSKRLKTLLAQHNNDDAPIPLTKKETIKNNLARVYEYFPVLKERSKQVSVSLSGGEQQMLAIGRALMSNPKLLVLDEPSLGLAPLIVKDIFKIVKAFNEEGTSVLIVEQNALQTLKIANYAYVLQVGKVIKEGPAETLIKDRELIEAYLGE